MLNIKKTNRANSDLDFGLLSLQQVQRKGKVQAIQCKRENIRTQTQKKLCDNKTQNNKMKLN